MTYSTLGQPGEFLEYPTNKLVGVFADWASAQTAIDRLADDGYKQEQIGVLKGMEGVHQLDASGQEHGVIAQISRFFSNFADMDAKHTKRHEQELLAGHVIVAVDGEDEARREKACQVMKAAGGYFINYYGKWAVENLEA